MLSRLTPGDRVVQVVTRYSRSLQERRYSSRLVDALNEVLYIGQPLLFFTPWCLTYGLQERWDGLQVSLTCGEREVFVRMQRVLEALKQIQGVDVQWTIVLSPSTNRFKWIPDACACHYQGALQKELRGMHLDSSSDVVFLKDVLPDWAAAEPTSQDIPDVLSPDEADAVRQNYAIPNDLFLRKYLERERFYQLRNLSFDSDILRATVLRQIIWKRKEGELYFREWPEVFFVPVEEIAKYDGLRLGYTGIKDRMLTFLPVAPWRNKG